MQKQKHGGNKVRIQLNTAEKKTDLSRLHLLGASSKGHVGVTGAGAVPFLLLHGGDEGVGFAAFPLAAPVVEDLLDELVVLLQQKFGFRKTHKLDGTTKRCFGKSYTTVGATNNSLYS